MQVTLASEKGGDPGSVKNLSSIFNQAHPNSPSSTILVSAFFCDEDKYDKFSAILETHFAQIDTLFVAVLGTTTLVRRPAEVTS